MRAAAVLATAALAVPALAHAYCSPENSPFYRWDRYTYGGGVFCRHWNFYAFDDNYLMGIAPLGIDPATYVFTVRGAGDRWRNLSTPSMPSFHSPS